MNGIEIAPLLHDDIPAVAELEKSTFSLPFTEEAIGRLILSTSWRFLAAKEDNKVVGYISFYTIFDETEIANLCVDPSLRGRGIGKALVLQVMEFAKENGVKKLMLEVRKSNEVAIGLYRGLGFIPVGVSKNHYKLPTEDAILMNLEF